MEAPAPPPNRAHRNLGLVVLTADSQVQVLTGIGPTVYVATMSTVPLPHIKGLSGASWLYPADGSSPAAGEPRGCGRVLQRTERQGRQVGAADELNQFC